MSIEESRTAEGIAKLKEGLGLTNAIQAVDPITDGSKMDWTKYDLDEKYFFFYPKAKFEELEQGWKWVAPYTEFHNENVRFDQGKLATYLEVQLNGPNGWQLVAVVYNGAGQCNVVLRRNTKLVLPDPTPINTEETVEAPTEEQLNLFDDASKKWEAEGVEG